MDCDCKKFTPSKDAQSQDQCTCGHNYLAHLQVVIGECSQPIESGLYK